MFDTSARRGVLTPALIALLAAGCGGGEGGGDSAGGEGEAGGEAAMESPVDESTAGNISGTVAFEGTPPSAQPIDMSNEPACADNYEGQPMTQSVVVNDGRLAEVFVYVREGLQDLQFPTPGEPVLLDQEGCRYRPHVLGVMTNQTITIRNSDGILHNINAQPAENRGFNFGQPTTMETTRSFPLQEVMIPVECDVHGWMSAFVGVLDHPYYAVSAEDGTFSLETLPPGDYVLEAWHERYGTQTANVTVATGETADVQFTFSEGMAENAVVPLGEPVDLHDHGTGGHAGAGQP